MMPKLTLWSVFAAYWPHLTREARRRHVAMWIVDWGKAIASHYRRCAYCERIYGRRELDALDLIEPVLGADSHPEIRLCPCGSSIVIERKK